MTERSDNPRVIYCAGDSLTASVIQPDYPAVLQERFESIGQPVRVINQGKPGYTVGGYLAFQQGEVAQRELIKAAPDDVLLLLGGNDTRSTAATPLAEFREQYRALVDRLRQAQNQDRRFRLWLGKIPWYYGPIQIKWQGGLHTFDAAQRIVDELNPAIAEIAQETGAHLVDLYSPLREAGRAYFADGLHPNREGNRLLAQVWFDALQSKST